MKLAIFIFALVFQNALAFEEKDLIGRQNPSNLDGVVSSQGFSIEGNLTGSILNTIDKTFFVISKHTFNKSTNKSTYHSIAVKEVPRLLTPRHYVIECFRLNQESFKLGIVGEVITNETDIELTPVSAWILKTDPPEITKVNPEDIRCINAAHPTQM